MAWTRMPPSSSRVPYSRPPRLMEKACICMMYDWKALAACLSKDSEVQWDASCLRTAAHRCSAACGLHPSLVYKPYWGWCCILDAA